MADFFQSSTALIAGVAALVGAIASLLQVWNQLRKRSELVQSRDESRKAMDRSIDRIRDEVRQRLQEPAKETEMRHGLVLAVDVMKGEIHERLAQALLPTTQEVIEQVIADVLRHVDRTVSEQLCNMLTVSGERPLETTVKDLLKNGDISNEIDRAIRQFIAQARVTSLRVWKGATIVLFVLSALLIIPWWATSGRRPVVTRNGKNGNNRVTALLPNNERWVQEAWEFFKEGEDAEGEVRRQAFQKAIEPAQKCVDAYRSPARKEQTDLIANGVPEPKPYPETEEERELIFSRGLVNGVGTSYWIIGRSAEFLGNTDQAKAAYRAASYFRHAATWDPNGEFFWFPGKDAAARLEIMEEDESGK